MKTKQNLLCNLEKLIEYSDFAVKVVLSNRCAGPLPRIKLSLFLLSIIIDELIPTPKIMAFLHQSEFGIEKNERESKPIQYPKEEYFSGSANKQSLRVKSAFQSFVHLSNS